MIINKENERRSQLLVLTLKQKNTAMGKVAIIKTMDPAVATNSIKPDPSGSAETIKNVIFT